MRLTDNDFQLFGLPETQAQARADIDARWKALQAEVHPDRFAAEGAAAQRVAMQWAMRVNEGYQRLKDPLKRAAYLCELRGAPVQAENNTAMPPAFLMQQMEWREALDDASSETALEALDEDLESRVGDEGALGAIRVSKEEISMTEVGEVAPVRREPRLRSFGHLHRRSAAGRDQKELGAEAEQDPPAIGMP